MTTTQYDHRLNEAILPWLAPRIARQVCRDWRNDLDKCANRPYAYVVRTQVRDYLTTVDAFKYAMDNGYELSYITAELILRHGTKEVLVYAIEQGGLTYFDFQSFRGTCQLELVDELVARFGKSDWSVYMYIVAGKELVPDEEKCDGCLIDMFPDPPLEIYKLGKQHGFTCLEDGFDILADAIARGKDDVVAWLYDEEKLVVSETREQDIGTALINAGKVEEGIAMDGIVTETAVINALARSDVAALQQLAEHLADNAATICTRNGSEQSFIWLLHQGFQISEQELLFAHAAGWRDTVRAILDGDLMYNGAWVDVNFVKKMDVDIVYADMVQDGDRYVLQDVYGNHVPMTVQIFRRLFTCYSNFKLKWAHMELFASGLDATFEELFKDRASSDDYYILYAHISSDRSYETLDWLRDKFPEDVRARIYDLFMINGSRPYVTSSLR